MNKWNMKNIIIIGLLVLITLPLVMGTTMCDYSSDNTTWYNITGGGFLDETGRMAGVEYLNETTIYYFRCKNDTTRWSYLEQKTDMEGEARMESLSITLMLSSFAITFIGIGVWLFFRGRGEDKDNET